MIKQNQHAFTLLELMVSMALSSVILMGLLQFSQVALRQIKASRDRFRMEQSLSMAKESLMLRTRGLEPTLWEHFPRERSMIHEVDHAHGALDFHQACPENKDSACLTTWDVRLPDVEPLFHDVIADDFPHRVRLAVRDSEDDLFEALLPMSILLFFHSSGSFCALVSECWADEVELIPLEHQPWALPSTLPNGVEVMLLGYLDITHVRLETEVENQLLWRSWLWEANAWQAGRRQRGDDLRALLYEPCTEAMPDRLTLVTQVPRARWLMEPFQLAGKRFEKEVHFAALEF